MQTLNTAKVLLVDDDPDITYAFSRILEKSGYEVKCASSIDTALTIIPNWIPDVILSDYQLANKTGGDLIEVIERLFPELMKTMKFVFLTGNTIRAEEDSRCNGILVLDKPIRFSALQDTLTLLLSSD